MDPVSNVDRLVLILRQQLAKRARAGGRLVQNEQTPRETDGVRSLAAIQGLDDRQLRRALVQNALADEFGPELTNEAQFQQVVDRVTETMEEHETTRTLLNTLVGELRAASANP